MPESEFENCGTLTETPDFFAALRAESPNLLSFPFQSNLGPFPFHFKIFLPSTGRRTGTQNRGDSTLTTERLSIRANV